MPTLDITKDEADAICCIIHTYIPNFIQDISFNGPDAEVASDVEWLTDVLSGFRKLKQFSGYKMAEVKE